MTDELRPQQPSGARRNWLGRSARVCQLGIAAARALIRRSRVTTRTDLLAFARESISLAERRHAELAAIPVPKEDRAAIRALLARDPHRPGQACLAERSLEQRRPQTLAGGGPPRELALKSNALELGSRDCARYFDPATYTR